MDKLDIFEGMEGADLVQETFLFRELSFDEKAKFGGDKSLVQALTKNSPNKVDVDKVSEG